MIKSPYTFHIEQHGNPTNPPVLFLHGFLGSSRDWATVAEALSDEFFCVVPDLPGHGKTVVENDKQWFTMENTAAALGAWLEGQGVERCGVVGYSMGGRLALYLAGSYPERFDKVVLESASPGLKTEAERQARRKHDEALASAIEHGSFETFLKNWYRQPVFASLSADPARLERLIAERLAVNKNRHGLSLSLRMMGTGAQPSLWEKLPEFRSSLLLLIGEKDAKFQAVAAEMVKCCPAARLRCVAGAGHTVHWEQESTFIRLVRQFLRSEKKGA